MTATMRPVWYERRGPAREVLVVGELPSPSPSRGEVRGRPAFSGVNPSDTKKGGADLTLRGRTLPVEQLVDADTPLLGGYEETELGAWATVGRPQPVTHLPSRIRSRPASSSTSRQAWTRRGRTRK